jgi:transcriptional regulator of acetoin/glycerol metabolism
LLSADAVELVTTAWNDRQLLHTVKFLLEQNSTAPGCAEPSDADIEQALLRARGTLAKAARQLGMSKETLIRRMHRLRMMN